MSTVENVTVKAVRLEEDRRKIGFSVEVRSKLKNHLLSTTEIDPTQMTGTRQVIAAVQAAGGACAEYLGERYGDPQDVGACSRFAVKALHEELKLLSELAKSVPERLTRLEAHKESLKDVDRSILEKMRWVMGKGQHLTPSEVTWIDEKITEVHGGLH